MVEMGCMRVSLLVAVIVVASGCTKRNPDLCCTDSADCAANDIPDTSTCSDGLVCVGHQCIAETCGSSADCNATNPYCSTGLCGPTCSANSQCPGAGEEVDLAYCVGGACVACRTDSDCATTAPVCDSGACRACEQDSECESEVCDLAMGTCVDESVILYASPTGSGSSGCNLAAPCTPTGAVSIVDGEHPWVRFLPGTYAPTIGLTLQGAVNLVATGAIWPGTIGASSGANATIRDLIVDGSDEYAGGIYCLLTTGTATLSLTNVVIQNVNNEGTAAFEVGGLCTTNVSQSELEGVVIAANASFSADRTKFTDGFELSAVPDGEGLHLSLVNSTFYDSGFAGNLGSGSTTSNAITMWVAYNTFYDDGMDSSGGACPSYDGSLASGAITFVNNIFYAPNSEEGFFIASGSGSGCTVENNVIFPGGSDNNIGNNIVADPMLVDPTHGNYHLMADSPAIDKAAATGSDPPVDFDGTPRPQGSADCIGAFEYKP